jgi:predicted lipoprotein with Yx(FWY)xxD motif
VAVGVAQASSSTVVTTKQTSLGTILVTSSGQTLYLDSADKPPHFACTGSCLKAWPPLKASGSLKAAGGAKASLLAKTKGPAGEVVTYAGHPLYTFASDTKSDPTLGEGLNGFYVVSPSGGKVNKPSSKKPPSKPTTY